MNIKTSLDMMKTTLQSAISSFVRKLDTKFNNIASWSSSLICPPPSGKCAPPWVNVPIPRSLVFQNGTAEEYAKALILFNETISNTDLTEEEEIVKDYVMSNPNILSGILRPIYERILKEIKIDNKEPGIVTGTKELFGNKDKDFHIFDISFDSKICSQKFNSNFLIIFQIQ